MQLDYTLSGFVYEGISVPSANLHLSSIAINDQNTVTVTASIYPTLAEMQSGALPLGSPSQWSYPVSNLAGAEALASAVWTTLSGMSGLTTSNGASISFSGAVAVSGE